MDLADPSLNATGVEIQATAGGFSQPSLDPHLEPVFELAQRCCYEDAHAHQVTALALNLFEGLSSLHRLNDKRKHWLTCAALLHDIGWVDGGKGHHKASLRYIVESPLLPWENRQRLIVGSIARYHRKALPSEKHDHYTALKPGDQADVRLLAGLLRTADGLDRGHRSIVRGLRCTISQNAIVISCVTHSPADLERETALRKSDLLETVLKRTIEVQWSLR